MPGKTAKRAAVRRAYLKNFCYLRANQVDAQHPVRLGTNNHLDMSFALIVCQ